MVHSLLSSTKMKINIIGTGKLGMTMAYLFLQYPQYQLCGVLNRNLKTSIQAIKKLGSGQAVASYAELPEADMTLIAVGDDQIASVSQMVHQYAPIQAGHILWHGSGCLDSHILRNPKHPQTWVASLHPLRSFAHPKMVAYHFAGTFCALEGDAQALAVLHQCFENFGARVFDLPSNKKALYHTGCIFASNYLVALSHQAIECLNHAGICYQDAKDSILNLMETTVHNLKLSQHPKNALTGPIQRGDIKTIAAHIQAMDNKEQKELYSLLGISTLNLCDHGPNMNEEITQILSKK